LLRCGYFTLVDLRLPGWIGCYCVCLHSRLFTLLRLLRLVTLRLRCVTVTRCTLRFVTVCLFYTRCVGWIAGCLPRLLHVVFCTLLYPRVTVAVAGYVALVCYVYPVGYRRCAVTLPFVLTVALRLVALRSGFTFIYAVVGLLFWILLVVRWTFAHVVPRCGCTRSVYVLVDFVVAICLCWLVVVGWLPVVTR